MPALAWLGQARPGQAWGGQVGPGKATVARWLFERYRQFGFVRCTHNLAKMLGLDLNFAN